MRNKDKPAAVHARLIQWAENAQENSKQCLETGQFRKSEKYLDQALAYLDAAALVRTELL